MVTYNARWITTKRPSECRICHVMLPARSKALYLPQLGIIYCTDCARRKKFEQDMRQRATT